MQTDSYKVSHATQYAPTVRTDEYKHNQLVYWDKTFASYRSVPRPGVGPYRVCEILNVTESEALRVLHPQVIHVMDAHDTVYGPYSGAYWRPMVKRLAKDHAMPRRQNARRYRNAAACMRKDPLERRAEWKGHIDALVAAADYGRTVGLKVRVRDCDGIEYLYVKYIAAYISVYEHARRKIWDESYCTDDTVLNVNLISYDEAQALEKELQAKYE